MKMHETEHMPAGMLAASFGHGCVLAWQKGFVKATASRAATRILQHRVTGTAPCDSACADMLKKQILATRGISQKALANTAAGTLLD